GPASQSYGLQVARLAGLPGSLLKHARATLQSLEQAAAAQQPQMDLFSAASAYPPEPPPDLADAWNGDSESGEAGEADEAGGASSPAPVRRIGDELRALAVDELTPRLALERIYQCRAMLDAD